MKNYRGISKKILTYGNKLLPYRNSCILQISCSKTCLIRLKTCYTSRNKNKLNFRKSCQFNN